MCRCVCDGCSLHWATLPPPSWLLPCPFLVFLESVTRWCPPAITRPCSRVQPVTRGLEIFLIRFGTASSTLLICPGSFREIGKTVPFKFPKTKGFSLGG